MANFGYDIVLVAIVCGLGIVSFKLAYWLGDPVWVKQFASSLPDYPALRLSSGEVGEIANLGLIAAILVLLLVLTPDANLYYFALSHWPWIIPAIVAIFLAIWAYTKIAVRKIEKTRFRPGIKKTEAHIRALARGYRYYVGYGTAVGLLILAIFAMTVTQIVIDFSRFQVVEARVAAMLLDVASMTEADPETLQTAFEVIYGTQQVAEGYILDQVNSLLMLLLCVMLAYSTIYGTSIRQVFAEEALHALRLVVMVLVAVCIVYGCTVFFTLHVSFVDGLRDQLDLYVSRMNAGPWPVTQRFHELLTELAEQRGVFGFLLALTAGRGGLILVAPVAGYFLRSLLTERPKTATQ